MLFVLVRRPIGAARSKASRRPRHAAGQAIVELALSLTFLALLFSAAVDLGIAYKSYQTLINATAEASGYLKLYPVLGCPTGASSSSCDPADTTSAIARADREARVRFRGEQGDQLRGTASTLDLDSDDRDDLAPVAAGGNGRSESWLAAQWVRIDEADQEQVTLTNSNFAIDNSFNPASTRTECQNRESVYTYTDPATGVRELRQCFLVLRTQILYHPFAIAPFVGQDMTIRAISVIPIVR